MSIEIFYPALGLAIAAVGALVLDRQQSAEADAAPAPVAISVRVDAHRDR